MAQSSAQRDPSMEEILASIRRIIEEGEEARQKPADLRNEFDAVPIGPAANDTMRRPVGSAPQLRTDMPLVEPDAFQRVEPEFNETIDVEPASADIDTEIAELSLSLDDFVIEMDEMREVEQPLGSVFSEDARQPDMEALRPASVPAGQISPPAARRAEAEPRVTEAGAESSHSEISATDTDIPDRKEAVIAAVNAVTSSRSPRAVSAETAPVVQPEKLHKESVAGVPDVAPVQIEHKSPMLSQVVERQVAASFTELSEALASSRRRPLDQIAEEMMRPMLQEWLDNNLPNLVERLVREEIERVARGAS